MRLDYLTRALAAAGTVAVGGADKRLAALTAKLDALSPLKVLSRGYAMVQSEIGEVVRNAAQLTSGQQVQITFGDGCAKATVTDVEVNIHGSK